MSHVLLFCETQWSLCLRLVDPCLSPCNLTPHPEDEWGFADCSSWQFSSVGSSHRGTWQHRLAACKGLGSTRLVKAACWHRVPGTVTPGYANSNTPPPPLPNPCSPSVIHHVLHIKCAPWHVVETASGAELFTARATYTTAWSENTCFQVTFYFILIYLTSTFGVWCVSLSLTWRRQGLWPIL